MLADGFRLVTARRSMVGMEMISQMISDMCRSNQECSCIAILAVKQVLGFPASG